MAIPHSLHRLRREILVGEPAAKDLRPRSSLSIHRLHFGKLERKG